jgi:1,4-dihydroxy-2-naphthoate octaprenyltransferase
LLTLVLIALGVAYSVGRRPWKNRTILGLIANALGHGTIVFLMGRVFVNQSSPAAVWYSVPYLFAVAAVYLATTVPDEAGDRLSGKCTLAVCIGTRRTMVVSALLVAAATLLALTSNDHHLTIAALASLPFFAAGIGRADTWAPRAAKAGVLALSISAAWAYPAYLALLAAGFVGTRLFFHWRFRMVYPSFGPGR